MATAGQDKVDAKYAEESLPEEKDGTTTTTAAKRTPIRSLEKKEKNAILDYLKYNVSTASVTCLGKKVEGFKGKHMMQVLQNYKKGMYAAEMDAVAVASILMREKHFIQVEVNPEKYSSKNKIIPVKGARDFKVKARYCWLYEGNKTWNNAFSAAIIAGFFLCCLFPIWPRFVKVGVWYCCVTFLLATLGFIVVRGAIFGLCWLAGYDVWVLPNVFDEELSVRDSFKPIISVEKAGGKLTTRLGLLVALVLFSYWVYQQPTEFDGYVQAQRDFLDDLYSGNLLSDRSQESVDNLDRVIPVEELLRMEQEEAAAAAAAKTRAELDPEDRLIDDMLNELLEEDEEEDDD
eukprot:g1084.t1